MSEEGEFYRQLDEYYAAKRANNLKKAQAESVIPWEKHTEYHWYYFLNGKKLDYWPSKNKFMYEGKVMVGDVIGFIKNKEVSP